jgi:hypothetical protein
MVFVITNQMKSQTILPLKHAILSHGVYAIDFILSNHDLSLEQLDYGEMINP